MKPVKFLKFLVVLLFLIVINRGTPDVHAQGGETPTSVTLQFKNVYFTSEKVTYADGSSLDEYIINGPPVPPKGYESERQAVTLPETNRATGTVTLTVPAFDWSFGCSATSGAMIAAYYDRNGAANMYTGPTDGGVMPLDSSSWPDWTDGNGDTYAQCPLTASHNGLDGRTTRGSIDDYWVAYNSTDPDPYITNGWAQHAWGDAIGDYMKTSQSYWNNVDGSTHFTNWTFDTGPFTCSDMVSYGKTGDGTYGRKLFYEARGYTVTDCYNQKTDNNGGGFTFAMYKAEIDAGRPVMLNLAGHTIVGIGYDDSTDTVYLHDTWDYDTHTMTWGTSYANMQLLSVSIVNFSGLNPPLAFAKISPANAATGVSTSPTLNWGTSAGATSYEYCYSTNIAACSSWTSIGANTSIALSGLSAGTTYYWQVRAVNSFGATYADGTDTAFWSFTTGSVPGAFAKTAPADAAPGVSTSPALSWGTSTGATSYEYCYDASDDNACSNWTSTGANTSIGLSGLSLNTTYYWQVRAVNSVGTTYADGMDSAFWSFTTGNVSGAFAKAAPANAATGVSIAPTLSWGTSTGATSYAYCYDTTNDNACSSWTSTGANTSIALSGLKLNTTYYWQVRAVNSFGTTYANGTATAFWSFTTGNVPGAFAKTVPANGATGQSTSLTLSWGTSTGATSYAYCYDTTNDKACSNWMSAGANTSVALNGLSLKTTYYWHVRAVNSFGTTYANGTATAFWSFTTGSVPDAFAKTTPANAATGVSTSPTLIWETSPGAISYEYCYSTNNTTCTSWTSTSANTSIALSGLSLNTTYYWQVRVTNAGGTTYANGKATAFWSFTTGSLPGAFAKTAPANAATGVSVSPTLSWGMSTGASSYEYCYDTTDDGDCDGTWISVDANTSIGLSRLSLNTTYYWQVRAVNSFGTTYANSNWFSFTIVSTWENQVYLPLVIR